MSGQPYLDGLEDTAPDCRPPVQRGRHRYLVIFRIGDENEWWSADEWRSIHFTANRPLRTLADHTALIDALTLRYGGGQAVTLIDVREDGQAVRPADVCADQHAASHFGQRYTVDEIAEHLEQLEVKA